MVQSIIRGEIIRQSENNQANQRNYEVYSNRPCDSRSNRSNHRHIAHNSRREMSKKEYPIEIAFRTRVLWTIIGLLEQEMFDMEETIKKLGYGLTQEHKMWFNRLLYAVTKLREVDKFLSYDAQMSIGDMSDIMRLMVWRITANCLDDATRLRETYNALKAMYKPYLEIDTSKQESILYEFEGFDYEQSQKENG